MTVVECILIEDCMAQKRVGNKAKSKPFRTGQRVRGVVTNIALTPDSQVMALKTKDGFVIPEPFLNVIGAVNNEKAGASRGEEVQYAEIVEEDNYKTSGAKNIVKAYEGLKASDLIKQSTRTSKFTAKFAVGGALVGVVYAMLRGKNKALFSAIGAVGGGLLGNYYGKKIKENEKTA